MLWVIANGFVGVRSIARNCCGIAFGVSRQWPSPASINMNTATSIAEANAQLTAVASNGATVFTIAHRFAAAEDASLTWATADFHSHIDTLVADRSVGRSDDMFIIDWLKNVVNVSASSHQNVTHVTTIVATQMALYSDSKCSLGNAHFRGKKLFRVGNSVSRQRY